MIKYDIINKKYYRGDTVAKFDDVFDKMCLSILKTGVSSEGEEVRPHWEDGTPAHTIKQFAVVNTYDLSKEFPAPTQRPIAFKSCLEEMLWIWQKHSNNVKDLKTRIWDSWADSDGSIGKAYGYQLNKDSTYTLEDGKKYRMNPVDKLLYDLHTTPFSRRLIVHMYNIEDLDEMNLYPCAYSMTFNVTKDKRGNKVLNAILNQRSQDVLAANAWNVCQYSVLLHMLARECDMYVGKLVHVIADAHIYDRHVEIVKELIERPKYKAPKLWINPLKQYFYEYTVDDFKLVDYEHGEQIKGVPIAI